MIFMKKIGFYIIFIILFTDFISNVGLCLDAKDILKLKNGGISEETVLILIEEKIIETCAFTVEEILSLKRAGMTNETIRKIVMSASFIKDNKIIEYGKEIRPIKFSSVKDIIELKNAGISDEVIQAIVSGSLKKENEENDNAWKMLENMGLIVDERK